MLGPKIPLPPEKPSEIAESNPGSEPETAPGEVPLPPRRPSVLVAYTPGLPAIPILRIIDGAEPILPAHFVPFPKA